MDARQREEDVQMQVAHLEESQSRRTSIKRAWEEDAPEQSSWPGGILLPPIDAAPFRRPSLSSLSRDYEDSSHNRYGPAGEAVKRTKYQAYEYNMLSRENLDLNGRILQAQGTHSKYNVHRSPLESPSLPQRHAGEGWGKSGALGEAAGSLESSNLCRRCKRLTTQRQDLEVDESCENCRRDPEGVLVTTCGCHLLWAEKKLQAGLGQLEETLTSGISSEQRNATEFIGVSERSEFRGAGYPPITQAGHRHTLNWILDRICHINELADKFVQNVPPRTSPNIDKIYIGHGTVAHDGLVDIMRRRIDADSDDSTTRDDIGEPMSDAKVYTRRGSVTAAMSTNEDLPPMSSSHVFHHTSQSLDGQSRRASIMNPPPVRHRQLPSPPGPSLSSPRSLNFPSSSVGSYAYGPPPTSFPPPSTLHQTALNTYLPPITPTSDAHQAHSAALQHEVALQKIALSSLQGEHDKLLAAFTRLRIRAETLEKKYEMSDNEIISLTEEKLRLQSQVIELERSVAELARSRDGFRQAAVQEGAQYIEMIRRASRLEELAAEEKKSWNNLKAEMEQRIKELTVDSNQTDSVLPEGGMSIANSTDTANPSKELQLNLKTKPAIENHSSSYGSSGVRKDVDDELQEEVQRLRNRCAEVEDALRVLRDESRNMEGIVEAFGLARKSILEKADRALSGVGQEPRPP